MIMTNTIRTRSIAALLAAATLGSAGCASMSQKERGAVIGAGAGAAIGGVIGNQTGSTARGAIIGAVVGGAAGAIIGHQMDQQAKELDQSIPGAKVERVGEGIQVTFESGLLFDFDSDRIRPDAAHSAKYARDASAREPSITSLPSSLAACDTVGNLSPSSGTDDEPRCGLLEGRLDPHKIVHSGTRFTDGHHGSPVPHFDPQLALGPNATAIVDHIALARHLC